MEKSIILNGSWLLATDPDNLGRENEFALSSRPDAKPATVPGTIQQVYPTYEGVLWYYRQLDRLPDAEDGERLHLHFENVDYYCDVYLDGVLVGSHEGAQAPFTFDVTEKAKAGSLLAVRILVPKGEEKIDGMSVVSTPHSCKGGGEYPIGGTYNYGGILGDVTLCAVPAVRIADAFVRADYKTGAVSIEVTYHNDTEIEETASLRVLLTSDVDGVVCAQTVETVSIAVGESQKQTSLSIQTPKLWSFDTPHLYTAVLELNGEGGKRAFKTITFGFRDFRVEKGFFYLNGKRVYLKCAHTTNVYPETVGGVPPKGYEALEYKDFVLMKSAGFNCIRFIACQATERQLDYCDHLGLMVYQETFASWYLYDNDRTEEHFHRTWKAAIHRDRNHPCIVIWGLLNETFQSQAHRAALAFLPELRKWDDTRLVVLSSGTFVPDFVNGNVANPGMDTWDCCWGSHGTDTESGKGALGDYHTYPRWPHGVEGGNRIIRNYGAGGKPVFISEYGVGSQLDVETICRYYEMMGVDPQAPDRRIIERIRAKYEQAFERLGMGKAFAKPVDFLLDSQRYNARSRREGMDLVRANPRFCGYSMTSATDVAISGEGVISLFRSIKKDNYDVLVEGWADLRWSLFVEKGNMYSGDEQTLEAVLSNIDVLPEGEYAATFAVVDEGGIPIWKHKETFTLPVIDTEGLPMLAVPIMKQTVKLDGKNGKYYLRAYLDQGGAPAAHEKAFYISEKPKDMLNKTIGGIGLSKEAIEFLAEHGVTVSEDYEACDTILVGMLWEKGMEGPNSLNWGWTAGVALQEPQAEEIQRKGNRLMELCEAGKTVIFADSFFLHNHDGDHVREYLDFFGLKDLAIFLSPDWLYHKDCAVIPHRYTEGVKCGFLDWDWYHGCLPLDMIVTETDGDTAGSFIFLGGPIWCKPYSEFLGGSILSEYQRGAGKFVLSAFPILQQPHKSPAAGRLLLNLLQ